MSIPQAPTSLWAKTNPDEDDVSKCCRSNIQRQEVPKRKADETPQLSPPTWNLNVTTQSFSLCNGWIGNNATLCQPANIPRK